MNERPDPIIEEYVTGDSLDSMDTVKLNGTLKRQTSESQRTATAAYVTGDKH